ncbi:hypothetical protein Y1Q_0000532 [Alligator mississippiensis]|uniref:Uncharacterized protein n=1 Tax=Alligator mississippiensis TaxID=8496 RepID=A0A151MBR5_ALLMI|nr:hypothetical protein Y1Q_0000532 [Alligator mississippiensis]
MKGSGSRSGLPFTHSFHLVQVAKWVEGSWESWSQSPVCWSILPTWNGTAREEGAAIGVPRGRLAPSGEPAFSFQLLKKISQLYFRAQREHVE